MPRLFPALSYSRVIYKFKWSLLPGRLRFWGRSLLTRVILSLYRWKGFVCFFFPDDYYRTGSIISIRALAGLFTLYGSGAFFSPPSARKSSPAGLERECLSGYKDRSDSTKVMRRSALMLDRARPGECPFSLGIGTFRFKVRRLFA